MAKTFGEKEKYFEKLLIASADADLIEAYTSLKNDLNDVNAKSIKSINLLLKENKELRNHTTF
jgi:hypothetical protein